MYYGDHRADRLIRQGISWYGISWRGIACYIIMIVVHEVWSFSRRDTVVSSVYYISSVSKVTSHGLIYTYIE